MESEVQTKRPELSFSNEELAHAYFDVATAHNTGNFKNYRIHANLIARAKTPITAFYKGHGSLDQFRSNGIGRKTKVILDMLLRDGTDATKRLLRTSTDETILKYQFAGVDNMMRRVKGSDGLKRGTSHNTHG